VIRRRVVDVALWLAAAAGVLCIAAVIAAAVFQVSMIMFATGSMSPTIPTGSLAVVHKIPASEIRLGEVVTVDRDGELPITHRVVGIEKTPGAPAFRTITLRGDANTADDPAPYVVSSVRLVWWSVPGLARVIVWFSNPFVLGGITLAAAALVTWAFWPRGAKPPQDPPGSDPPGSSGSGSSGSGDPATPEEADRPRRRRITVTAMTAATAALIGVGSAAPAGAAPAETVVRSTYLVLTSVGDEQAMTTLQTDDPVDWEVGVAVDTSKLRDGNLIGRVHIGLGLDGDPAAAQGLDVQVLGCPERWDAGVCAVGMEQWLPPTPIADAVAPVTAHDARELTSTPVTAPRWALVRVVRRADAAPGATASLRLQAWAEGDSAGVAGVETGNDGGGGGVGGAGGSGTGASGLPITGVDGVLPAALAAAGAILVGLAVAAGARLRPRRARRSP
jgi:signal peptidase I